MNAEIKQRYQNIITQCQKFSKFNKLFSLISNNIVPANKDKFNNVEKFDYEYTSKSGKEQWQTMDVEYEEVYVSVKKFDTHYQLRVLNKDLSSFECKSLLDVENSFKLNENAIAVIEVHNMKKGVRYFLEIVVAKENNNMYLVQKDWSYSTAEEKWLIDCEDIKLTPDNVLDITQ